MHSLRFRELASSRGPFASIYFDDSHDTQDAADQLDAKWHDLRRDLEHQGADAGVIASLEKAILDARPPVGRSGRGLVAGTDGVLVNEHLDGPPVATVVRVSELPYIVPLVQDGAEHTTYTVVAVDHVGADVKLYRRGTVQSHTVEAGGYPIHKSSAADNAGYGDPQQRTNAIVRKNIHAVTDYLTTQLDETGPEVVFVVGQVRSRAELISQLPKRVAARVVELHAGERRTGVNDEVRQAIDAEFERRRQAAIGDAAERFQAEKGRESGHAVEGLVQVCAALREGAVETLIIGDLGDATLVTADDLTTLAPSPDVLSEFGAAPTHTVRADEALPFAAISIDASLVRAGDRFEPADGIAALLRYPLATA